jgi:catechol 2,3-dioxygenase-like lactoylglutathione lyase family enzyme
MPIGNNNQVIPGCGVHHLAVQCNNLEESLHFYCDVLGMTPVVEFTTARKIVLVDIGDGSHMELLGPRLDGQVSEIASAPIHPLVHLALTTTDTRAAVEKVRAAGYAVTVEPKDVSLGSLAVTNAFFKGPNDEIIEFFQVKA